MRSGLRRGARALSVAATLLVTAGHSSFARAEPSLWDKARNPKLTRAHRLLVRLEEHREAVERSSDPARQLQDEVAWLEMERVMTLPEPRLWFLFGEMLSSPVIGRYEEAKAVLQRALAAAGDSVLAGPAWVNLALTAAHTGDVELQEHAYEAALGRVWQRELRAQIYYQRAQFRLSAGAYREAIADYNKAGDIAYSIEIRALSRYGLAVALEQAGDLPAALEQIHAARSIAPHRVIGLDSVLDLPVAIFAPSYVSDYFHGLEEMSDARYAADPAKALSHYEAAESYFERFVGDAEPDGHAWVKTARRHLAYCKEERARLERERDESK